MSKITKQDLVKLKELITFSDRYELSIQFWPNQVAVYIAKNGIDLNSVGGDFSAIDKALDYLKRINKL